MGYRHSAVSSKEILPERIPTFPVTRRVRANEERSGPSQRSLWLSEIVTMFWKLLSLAGVK